MPFLCLNINLYQNPITNGKSIAVHISWLLSVHMISYNIDIRQYNLKYVEHQEETASEILFRWVIHILPDFHISSESDILTNLGYNGPDVKKVQGKYLLSLHKWCVTHLINAALVESFGTTEHKSMSKT